MLGREVATAFACPAGHVWPSLRGLRLPSPRCPSCEHPDGSIPTELAWQIGRGMLEQHADTLLSRLVPPGDVLAFAGADPAEAINIALPGALR